MNGCDMYIRKVLIELARFGRVEWPLFVWA